MKQLSSPGAGRIIHDKNREIRFLHKLPHTDIFRLQCGRQHYRIALLVKDSRYCDSKSEHSFRVQMIIRKESSKLILDLRTADGLHIEVGNINASVCYLFLLQIAGKKP